MRHAAASYPHLMKLARDSIPTERKRVNPPPYRVSGCQSVWPEVLLTVRSLP